MDEKRKSMAQETGSITRYEYKYLCTNNQMAILEHRVASLMEKDRHTGQKGYYTISSLYWDDYHNHHYFENEDGTDPREKFRIRIYDYHTDRMQLELKQKERGKTKKQSCPLTREEYYALMAGELEISGDNHELLNKLLLQIKTKFLEPKVVVTYDRVPFVYALGNVRITFDRHMASSDSVDAFGAGEAPYRSIMPTGLHLLEVKFDELIPDYIYRILQLDGLQRTAYSKYYLSRKFTV